MKTVIVNVVAVMLVVIYSVPNMRNRFQDQTIKVMPALHVGHKISHAWIDENKQPLHKT